MQPSAADALADEPAGRFRRVSARASRSADPRATGKRGASPQRASGRRWRVAFDEQVLSQAPEDAVGYRVVLPECDEWDPFCNAVTHGFEDLHNRHASHTWPQLRAALEQQDLAPPPIVS